MFTGLIQAVGTLFHRGDTQVYLRWETHPLPAALTDVELGDSIAIDGICLTVETRLPDGFVAAVSPETLDRTSLGHLESSLRVGSKIGGHFVTGHIDGQGHLEAAIATADSWRLSFTVGDRRVARYIVPKGSIAVNGISLTVADCSPSGDWFAAAVIPVTYRETTLQYLRPGQAVNLEGDVLGKYVEKFTTGAATPHSDRLSLEFLAEHGY